MKQFLQAFSRCDLLMIQSTFCQTYCSCWWWKWCAALQHLLLKRELECCALSFDPKLKKYPKQKKRIAPKWRSWRNGSFLIVFICEPVLYVLRRHNIMWLGSIPLKSNKSCKLAFHFFTFMLTLSDSSLNLTSKRSVDRHKKGVLRKSITFSHCVKTRFELCSEMFQAPFDWETMWWIYIVMMDLGFWGYWAKHGVEWMDDFWWGREPYLHSKISVFDFLGVHFDFLHEITL